MTDWADRQAAVQGAKLRTFGEPVRLYPETTAALPDNLASGQVITLPASGLADCELRDQNGVEIPGALWSCDLETGVLTMVADLDLTDYDQPLVAEYRVGVDLVGVVDLYAEEAPRRPRSSSVPLGTPQQLRPVVYLMAADAGAVAVRTELVARGQAYLAVAKDTDDGGLVRVELMRKPADAVATQHDRWQ